MTFNKAKNTGVGDIVILKNRGGIYEITSIDESRSTSKRLCFWSNNITFDHKEIMSAFRENK